MTELVAQEVDDRWSEARADCIVGSFARSRSWNCRDGMGAVTTRSSRMLEAWTVLPLLLEVQGTVQACGDQGPCASPSAEPILLPMMPLPAVRTYRNPPLLEAVVEFQFDPPAGGWKSVFLGKIHREIEREFPRVEPLVGARIELKPGSSRVEVVSTPDASRFFTEEGGMVATVGPDLMGLSVLPLKHPGGHPGWPALRDRALALLQQYRGVVGPQRVRQLGVRYINAIPVTPGEFRLSDIVAGSSGLVPMALLDEQNPFASRLERIRSNDERGRHAEVIQLSAQPASANTARLMLDVDQVWTPTQGTEPGDPKEILQDLHEAVHQVFVAAIRPEVLESFGPIETVGR